MFKRFLLDELICLDLEGSDARAFAQAQFTADIDESPAGQWSPLAWCDPKGRVLAFMLAAAGQTRIELLLPASQAEDMAKRLRMYTIGHKVTIGVPRAVAGTFGPHGADRHLATDAGRSIGAAAGAETDAQAMARWQHLDICQGLPWLDPPSSGQFLPQWLGLEQIGGLSYAKGCYPGQEVIARVHYLGSVKHGLRGLEARGPLAAEAHARIRDADGKALGHWLRGVTIGDRSIALAVLPATLADGAEVQIESASGLYPAQVTPIAALC